MFKALSQFFRRPAALQDLHLPYYETDVFRGRNISTRNGFNFNVVFRACGMLSLALCGIFSRSFTSMEFLLLFSNSIMDSFCPWR